MPAQSLKDIAIEFLALAAAGNVREAYARHVGDGFRHHNPFFRSDARSLMRGMEESAVNLPHKSLVVQRVLQDGDLVAVHSHVIPAPGHPGIALVHLFRFEGDRIVELWDIGQPVPDDAANELGMF